MGACGPTFRLHRPETSHLTWRSDGSDAGVGGQVLARQVERGECHGLVVETPRGSPDLRDGGDHRRHGLPRLIGVRRGLGHEGSVDLAGFEEGHEQCGDDAAVLDAFRATRRPRCIGGLDSTEALARCCAGECEVGVGGIGLGDELDGLGLGIVVRCRWRPGGLVAKPATRAEVPTKRAAGAHLDQLGQVGVGVDTQRVRWADGHARSALDATIGLDHTGLEFPEPRLARWLVDAVHGFAKSVALHEASSPIR